jgi:hypothetical protein
LEAGTFYAKQECQPRDREIRSRGSFPVSELGLPILSHERSPFLQISNGYSHLKVENPARRNLSQENVYGSSAGRPNKISVATDVF